MLPVLCCSGACVISRLHFKVQKPYIARQHNSRWGSLTSSWYKPNTNYKHKVKGSKRSIHKEYTGR